MEPAISRESAGYDDTTPSNNANLSDNTAALNFGIFKGRDPIIYMREDY